MIASVHTCIENATAKRIVELLTPKRLGWIATLILVACSLPYLNPGRYWASFQRHLLRHRSNIVFREIMDIELATERMRADAGVGNLRELFANAEDLDRGNPEEVIQRHTVLLNRLLGNGKSAIVDLKPEYRQRLGDHYVDIDKDWWKREFRFYMTVPNNGQIPELQTKLFSIYTTFSTPETRANWIRRGPEAPPPAIIISAGRDGVLAGLGMRPVRTVNNEILPMGDDITNLTSVGSLVE